MQDSKFADIYFYVFSSFSFKVPVENVVIDEKELHVIDVGELTRNIAKKGEARRFTSHYVTYATGKSIFSASM